MRQQKSFTDQIRNVGNQAFQKLASEQGVKFNLKPFTTPKQRSNINYGKGIPNIADL